jgi:hypothetical protein
MAVFVIGASAGCDRSEPKRVSAVTTEEIIRQNKNLPIGESIGPVGRSLAKHSVFVATENSPSTKPTTVTLNKLRFRTAQDNQGRMWAYAYTTQSELLRTFPQGTPYAELAFKDFFGIIERDGKFAGIFLNSGSDASYAMPRELFEKLKEVLRQGS